MEVVLIEDPACSWCWAFQPVETSFLFEYGGRVRLRRVMGGLRDWPLGDGQFLAGQWDIAARVSGMPMDTSVWEDHLLETTWTACRAVKAVQSAQPERTDRFLRRLREAFCLERRPIDRLDDILALAEEVRVDTAGLQDQLASGRADAFFHKDRELAACTGFGFPSVVVHPEAGDGDGDRSPELLQGLVSYGELTAALSRTGFPHRRRRRFHGKPDDWSRLFDLRPRVTLAELRTLTQQEDDALVAQLEALGAVPEGSLWRGPGAEEASPVTNPVTAPEPELDAGAPPAAGEPEPGGDALRDPDAEDDPASPVAAAART